MKKLFLFVVMTIFSFSLYAENMPKPSPYSSIEQDLGTGKITLKYSRPSVKGRTIFGDLVPFDKVWRTGANKATYFETDQDLVIGGKELKKGKYAIFTTPGKEKWHIHFNKNTEQFGTSSYKTEENAISVEVEPKKTPSKIETFTICFSDLTFSSLNMNIVWEDTKINIPVSTNTEKNVGELVHKKTEDEVATTLIDAADYYSQIKKYEKAVSLAMKSIKIHETVRSHYILGNIYERKGDKVNSNKSYQNALTLAENTKRTGWIDFLKSKVEESK